MDAIGENHSKDDNIRARSPDNIDNLIAQSTHVSRGSVTRENHLQQNSIIHSDDTKADTLKPRKESTDALRKVWNLHSRINHELKGIDTKYEDCLHRREKQFTEAYSRFMIRTQHELKELKKKFEMEDLKRQQSSHVVELQNKMKLFRDETIKLSEENSNLIKENSTLKSQLTQLSIQNEILSQHIKAAVEKKVMKKQKQKPMPMDESFEASYMTSQNKSSAEMKSSPNKSFSYHRTLSRNTTPGKIIRTEQSPSKNDIFSLSKVDLDNLPPLARFEKLISEISQIKACNLIIEKIEKTGRAIVHELDNKLDRTLKELEKVIKEKKELLRKKVGDPLGDLENLFVDCVEQVRKDIFKRKVLLQQQKLNNLKNKDTLQPGGLEVSAQIVAKRNVEFEEFLMKDKQKLIEMFLTHKDVLYYIYEARSNRNLLNPEGGNGNLNPDASKLLFMLEEDVSDKEALNIEGKDKLLMQLRTTEDLNKNLRAKNDSFIENKTADKNENFPGHLSNITSLEIDDRDISGGLDTRKKKIVQPGKQEPPKNRNHQNPRNRVIVLNKLDFLVQNK